MMAKSELADIIKGEMNKESKQFIKELGKTETKTVVTEVETIVVNIIQIHLLEVTKSLLKMLH